jgi:hypothetical protein
MNNQTAWLEAKNRLVKAVSALGFAPEFGEVMARQLGSPKAIDRMTKYIYLARPRSEEMLVDEMLAICDEIDAWRRKKTGQEAQANYYALREYGGLGRDDTGEEE